jgi:hypothetical protein
MVGYLQADLISWGMLDSKPRRIAPKRNATNVYRVLCGCDCIEKQKKLLKPTTRASAAVRKPEKSPFRLRWEAWREKNQRDHQRKRQEFAERAKRWVELRRWREKQADWRSRREAEKHLGVYNGPKAEETTESIAWVIEWRRKNGLDTFDTWLKGE